jgi:hypothetical protein
LDFCSKNKDCAYPLRSNIATLQRAAGESTPSLLPRKINFPSEGWFCNDQDDFNTARTTVKGEYTMEICAQLRLTGLILDHFREVLGGFRHLEINTSLVNMIPNDRFTLQRKSHLCIPFLGIAWPQPRFPHSCVFERFI